MTNPLLSPSALPCGLPDFAAISVADLSEAFEAGLTEHAEQVRGIVADPEPPTVENTLVAFERSGRTLDRVVRIASQLFSANTDDELRELERDMWPRLSAHSDAIHLDGALFARLRAAQAGLGDDADPETRRLAERYVTEFTLAGAGLDDAGKRRLTELNQRIETLTTDFRTRLQADTNDLAVRFDDAAELDGMTPQQLAACRGAAEERGLDGYLVTLILPTTQPALAVLTVRESRRRIFEAARARGSRGNANDTRELVLELARLRAERAALLGYANHAEAVLADESAGSVARLREVVYPLAPRAAANAAREKAELQQFADAQADAAGEPHIAIEAWDWDFYAERLREQQFSVDTAALRPYFAYERVLVDGVFFAATSLYGITFAERDDLAGYHPDVRVFEVRDGDGSVLGLFLHDPYARDSKRGGAWMNSLVEQSGLDGQRPVVCNTLNIPKAAPGDVALLTIDEVRTMFHEFGHALHGLLSDTRYAHLAATAVPRDVVEFPSQVNEQWQAWPEVLAHYAFHHETGGPLDPAIADRLKAAEQFNQGYETVAYLGAALLDQAWHQLAPDADVADVAAFEARALSELGLDDPAIPPRYGSCYFNHVFGGGYDAAYYSYIYSEILDADTVEWFGESGGLDAAAGARFRSEFLSRGNSRDPLESYRAFRGRDAHIEPLLARRGLL